VKPVYLVAGASSGIGAAVAVRAAAAGAHVALCGRRRDALTAVADRCGGSAHVADVTSRSDVEALIDTVVDRHGRLDGVVANAGIMRAGGVLDLSDDDWDATLRFRDISHSRHRQDGLGLRRRLP